LHTLDPALSNANPYTKSQLTDMAEAAKRWLPDVKVRGV
jgi:hypothetical protein